jgi:hypothetical protein
MARSRQSETPDPVTASRRVTCVQPGLSVVAGPAGRTFAPGETVDLDAELAPGLTWAQALGSHVATHFAPIGAEE